jgi:hypothetical protein
MTAMNEHDADRLELLDRMAHRVPELDLDQQLVEWTTLPDGHEALLVNGGGIDGGDGAYFANAGDDLHAVGTLAPIIEGLRRLHRDPARWQPDSRSGGARPVGAREAGLMLSPRLIPAPFWSPNRRRRLCRARTPGEPRDATRVDRSGPLPGYR